MTYQAKVSRDGRIEIPAPLRDMLGIKEGDVLVLDHEPDGRVSLKTHAQIIREGQQRFRQMLSKPFTVDEFIAEKRGEAERE